jgi:Glutamyl-tRNA reductase
LLTPILCGRADRPLFIIDIAVPRDVAPEVNELDGVYLYDIDSLQEIASESLELRRQQLLAAEAIIDEHVADFQKYLVLADTGTRPISDCPTGVSGTLRTLES